jgi:Fur family transcriptional regulator, ferric uptake regulator
LEVAMKTHTTDGSLDELVELQLRRADLRYTEGRRVIVGLLGESGHPMSITEITHSLPGVPRSSAYRHLVVLESVGIVRRIAARDGFTRFELAEELTEHHHHLLCTACGQVFDVTPSAEYEAMTRQMVAELSDAVDFDAVSHSVDVVGHCASCR